MKINMVVLSLLAVFAAGCSSSSHNSGGDSGLSGHIMSRREIEIRRQAPAIGIDVNKALSTKVADIHLCPETGSNSEGSFTCDKACTGTECVHAWMQGAMGSRSVEYLFATPNIADGCIAHEVHHELIVVWYGIHGHPKRSTVTRLDNGSKLVIDHAGVIGWRWPSLVNWAIPKAYEIESDWQGDLKCGSDEVLVDGAGI